MVDIAQNLFSTRRGSILVGVGAAALAAIVVFVYLHNYRNSISSAAAPASVLVAKNLIQKGTPGDIIAHTSQFQVASIPRKELQIGALTDPAALNGRIAVADIYPGQQLTAGAFAYAADNGKLWFVLRPPSGAKVQFPGIVTAATLLRGYKAVK